MAVATVMVALVVMAVGGEAAERARYGLWRTVRAQPGWRRGLNGTRRVFGGEPAQLSQYPAVVALLDRYWGALCSAAWIAPRWALTAAHCVTPATAYVRYNARRPAAGEGDVAAVLYLFRHPEFRVVQEDEGRGEDVTLLHHDIGLVRTRRDMVLRGAVVHAHPLEMMRALSPGQLRDQQVDVLGFGGTDTSAPNDQLFAVRLRLVWCERGAWYHCVCATAAGTGRGRGAAGVCQGDSGGPALLRDSGVQVAVTSMGPMQCAAAAGVPVDATSVLTAVSPYVPLINATMRDADRMLAARQHPASTSAATTHSAAACIYIIVLVSIYEYCLPV